MNVNLELIRKKLDHLQRMRNYLDYSARHIEGMPKSKLRDAASEHMAMLEYG